jgi:hypothetical protein
MDLQMLIKRRLKKELCRATLAEEMKVLQHQNLLALSLLQESCSFLLFLSRHHQHCQHQEQLPLQLPRGLHTL